MTRGIRLVQGFLIATASVACVEVRSAPPNRDAGSNESGATGPLDAGGLDAGIQIRADGADADASVASDALDAQGVADAHDAAMDQVDVADTAVDEADSAVPTDIGVLDVDAFELPSDIVADMPDHGPSQDSPGVSEDRGALGEDLGPCAMGLPRCNGECVDPQRSTGHCGGCGTDCNVAFPGAAGECRSGRCAPTACLPGFGNCDLTIDNGCEVRTTDDRMNCGVCGRICQIPNAASVCSESLCRLVSCNTGFANCDGVELNGCEAALATNVNHCGACGRACPGENYCVAGECLAIPRSCADIHRTMPTRPSGTYQIDLDGTGTRAPMTVYCDMTTEEGGWTLVARVRGDSAAHYATGTVGNLTSPVQTTPAKLSDEEINLLRGTNAGGLASSVVRFDCLSQRTYFQENTPFSATSSAAALMRCSASPSGPWSVSQPFSSHRGLNTYLSNPPCPNVLYFYDFHSRLGCVCGTSGLDGTRDGVMYVR